MKVNNPLTAERPNKDTYFIYIVLCVCTSHMLIPKMEVCASVAIHVGNH